MKVELITKQEVVEHNHDATNEAEQERSVGAVALLTVEAPH